MSRALLSGAILLFAAGAAWAAPQDATPDTIYVQTRENLEGFNGGELPAFLAKTIAAAQAGPWHFAVAPSGKSPPDRIEWSFVPGAEAAGTVRTYGFSRAMMERLVGSSRVFTIEARLYLHGEYQALASAQFRQTEDPQNAELVGEVTIIARNLMATPGIIEKASHPDPSARNARPLI